MTTQERCNVAIEELVRKHALMVEGLTEAQLGMAIAQAISCGDFQRHVRVERGRLVGESCFVVNETQAVIYEPYRRVRELEERVKELEAELDKAEDRELEAKWSEEARELEEG